MLQEILLRKLPQDINLVLDSFIVLGIGEWSLRQWPWGESEKLRKEVIHIVLGYRHVMGWICISVGEWEFRWSTRGASKGPGFSQKIEVRGVNSVTGKWVQNASGGC
jgi:hypothetical protein